MNYIFALSVVARKGEDVYNRLMNGIGNKQEIQEAIDRYGDNYGEEFKNNIILVNFNIAELNNTQTQHEINRNYYISYTIKDVLEEIKKEIR